MKQLKKSSILPIVHTIDEMIFQDVGPLADRIEKRLLKGFRVDPHPSKQNFLVFNLITFFVKIHEVVDFSLEVRQFRFLFFQKFGQIFGRLADHFLLVFGESPGVSQKEIEIFLPVVVPEPGVSIEDLGSRYKFGW